MMTKLADELEALAKDATPGPWSYEKDFEGSSMGWVDGPKRPREGKFPLCGLTLFDVCGDFGEQEINASLIVALRNALPEIIAALRQPDAVPGDPYVMGPPPVGIASYWPDDNGVMQPTNEAVPGDLVDRLDALIERQRNNLGVYMNLGTPDPELVEARAAIQSLTAERDTLQEFVEQVASYENDQSKAGDLGRQARALLEGSKP